METANYGLNEDRSWMYIVPYKMVHLKIGIKTAMCSILSGHKGLIVLRTNSVWFKAKRKDCTFWSFFIKF